MIGLDAAGRARQHHYAVGQEHRLLDAVRDEQHGLAVALPDLEQLVLQPRARVRIERAERRVIAFPPGVRVWLATGHTDMRKGFPSLALQVQEVLRRDPLSGHLFCFRGRRGDLLKVIWHDGQGACLFTKRLERGRFLWPSPADGVVTISAAQLGYLLSGIDWRHPQETWRPTSVG